MRNRKKKKVYRLDYHQREQKKPAPMKAPYLLLLLRIPQTQHKQILILHIIQSQRVRIRQHLPVERQDDPRERDAAPDRAHDVVAERRDEVRDRDLGESHDAPVELPCRLGGVDGELDLH